MYYRMIENTLCVFYVVASRYEACTIGYFSHNKIVYTNEIHNNVYQVRCCTLNSSHTYLSSATINFEICLTIV